LGNLKDEFTAVSTDESFFFFDSLVRRVWIREDERPVVRITRISSRVYSIWCYQSGRETIV
jgi:hypothetical protein